MPRLLVVAKVPLAGRLSAEESARLAQAGVYEEGAVARAAAAHSQALERVRQAIAGVPGLTAVERRVDRVTAADAAGCDLIVTVGGDGTVLTANALGLDLPMLTVNSDPDSSVGHFTRTTAETAAAALAQWAAGRAASERMARLRVEIGDSVRTIINDCLFTNANPGATSRYRIEPAGCHGELQRSSGVWVATAAGSTGAIRSAGADPVPTDRDALLFKVREPFEARGRFRLLGGLQTPPQGVDLVPAIPGMALYLDGPNTTVPVPVGVRVRIRPDPRPLLLIR